MIFDFETFSKIAANVYRECSTTYSLEEALAVFRYFFEACERNAGQVHPHIRKEHIRNIIQVMPYPDTEGLVGGTDYLFPEDYPTLIDAYFATRFWDCDYRINHFFSGKVRTFRCFEEVI